MIINERMNCFVFFINFFHTGGRQCIYIMIPVLFFVWSLPYTTHCVSLYVTHVCICKPLFLVGFFFKLSLSCFSVDCATSGHPKGGVGNKGVIGGRSEGQGK
jgi:hypothetical protein